MILDPQTIPIQEMYRHMVACITPRPIAWVSTCDAEGRLNLAPFSYFNGVGANPPAIMFSPVNRRDGSRKDTVLNIEATKQFVVNVVSFALADQMNQSSADYDRGVSEFEMCGLTPEPSQQVKPPRVKEAAVSMECELHQIVPVGDGPLSANVIIGRVVLMHVAESVLDAAGRIDPDRLDTIGRMGGALYSRTRARFEMPRPSVPAIGS
ncbi:MAG: flavin reductase family protein [Phycisphaeraceae bacterium]